MREPRRLVVGQAGQPEQTLLGSGELKRAPSALPLLKTFVARHLGMVSHQVLRGETAIVSSGPKDTDIALAARPAARRRSGEVPACWPPPLSLAGPRATCGLARSSERWCTHSRGAGPSTSAPPGTLSRRRTRGEPRLLTDSAKGALFEARRRLSIGGYESPGDGPLVVVVHGRARSTAMDALVESLLGGVLGGGKAREHREPGAPRPGRGAILPDSATSRRLDRSSAGRSVFLGRGAGGASCDSACHGGAARARGQVCSPSSGRPAPRAVERRCRRAWGEEGTVVLGPRDP